FYLEGIVDLVLGHTPDALGNNRMRRDEEQAARTRARRARRRELWGLDHERMALPPANRVAKPRCDRGRRVLGIHADDTCFMQLFRSDDDRLGCLHDQSQIRRWHERHGRSGAERVEAALRWRAR